ncbi:MAG: aspartate aminotransferase family protein [Candidatus Bathyarchaeia archaeon]
METISKEEMDFDRKHYLHLQYADEEWVPIPVVRAEGCYLYGPNGEAYLDFMSQLECVNIGYSHPKVAQAIAECAKTLSYCTEAFLHPYRPKVCKLLLEGLGLGEWAGKLRFLSSGSEAVEFAIALAKLYTNKRIVIARGPYSYHGWTGGVLPFLRIRWFANSFPSAKEKGDVRYVPRLYDPPLVPAPRCFRCPLGYEYPDCKTNGMLACVRVTKTIIEAYYPDTDVAALIAEVAFGAGGNIVPPPEYWPQMYNVLKRYKVLWIDDEVICGFGRTGKWFAYQHWEGLKPDLMTFAKGFTSSAAPGAGVAISKEISEWLSVRRSFSVATYGAHPLALAAAYANIVAMKDLKILEHVNKMGKYLEEKLKMLEDNHKCAMYPGGWGLMSGLELVRNKETKEPIIRDEIFYEYSGDISNVPVVVFTVECLKRGLICGGWSLNGVRICPPLVITESEIDKGISVIDEVLGIIDKRYYAPS